MTEPEKIDYVEAQVRDIVRAHKFGVDPRSAIDCPFCGSAFTRGEAMCCYSMAGTLTAVVERLEVEKATETLAIIAEKASLN